MASFQAKIVGKGRERGKIKIAFPFRSYPTGNRKFQKKIKKNQKIKKYHCGFIPSKNRLERPRNGENKNFRSASFPLDA